MDSRCWESVWLVWAVEGLDVPDVLHMRSCDTSDTYRKAVGMGMQMDFGEMSKDRDSEERNRRRRHESKERRGEKWSSTRIID
jgi:hypothetical protein